jgi:hypothetical protein
MPDSMMSVVTKVGKRIGINKAHQYFLLHMIDLFLSIISRINFMSLSRHTSLYQELNLRLGFGRFVDFCALNQAYCQLHCSQRLLLAFDLTYLPKAGKATYGTDRYWSGSAQQTLWGLEAGLLSVIDLDNRTAFHLDAIATPPKAEREAKGIDLCDHYAQAILWACPQVRALSAYIALDAWFAKKSVIDRLTAHLYVICRLRTDAHCLYCYNGPPTGKAGRPQKYAGKIDWRCPDPAHFTLIEQQADSRVYQAVVYCKFLKQTIRIALRHCLDQTGQVKAHQIYCSTDLNLSASQTIEYYQARFQQEFLIRDAKQFTGLAHCQARSVEKLEYHWNCALTAINVAKVEHWLSKPKADRGPFSMSSIKTLYHNRLLIEKIFDNLPKQIQSFKITPAIEQLYSFGAI